MWHSELKKKSFQCHYNACHSLWPLQIPYHQSAATMPTFLLTLHFPSKVSMFQFNGTMSLFITELDIFEWATYESKVLRSQKEKETNTYHLEPDI